MKDTQKANGCNINIWEDISSCTVTFSAQHERSQFDDFIISVTAKISLIGKLAEGLRRQI
jgi:hypothetical protein